MYTAKKLLVSSVVAATTMGAPIALAGDKAGHQAKAEEAATKQQTSTWQETKQSFAEAKQIAATTAERAWLEGKLETTYLLNRHLNSFQIDTAVEGNTVYLNGVVDSEIDRELAEVVALNVEGIEKVENHLVVDKSAADEKRAAAKERSFSQRIDDATTTAIVKSKLFVNENISAMNVDVETHNDVVTLSGEVENSETKDLIYNVVAATDNVESVVNKLEVVENS